LTVNPKLLFSLWMLPLPAYAQNLLVVDPAQRPGATHASLAVALDEAQDGDLVHVRYGLYPESLEIVGKSLTLVGEDGVVVAPSLVIRDVPAGGSVVFRHLRLEAEEPLPVRSLKLVRCQGSVYLEDVEMSNGEGILIQDCSAVVFVRAAVSGLARSAALGRGLVEMRSSHVNFFDSQIRGMSAGLAFQHVTATLDVYGGSLGLYETEVGGSQVCCPMSLKPALRLAEGNPRARVRGSPTLGGVEVLSGTLTTLTGSPRELALEGHFFEGQPARLTARGGVGDVAWLLSSDRFGPARGPLEEPLLLGGSIRALFLGELTSSGQGDLRHGELARGFIVPALVSTIGRSLALQGFFSHPDDQPRSSLSAPTAVAILGATLNAEHVLTHEPTWNYDATESSPNPPVPAAAGDVDGDGFADLFVRLTRPTDDIVLYRGSAGGLGQVPVWFASAATPSGSYSAEARSAGDVNGDGFADVVVLTGTSSGAVLLRVFKGSPQGLALNADWTFESIPDFFDGYFGTPAAGDVDGDGFGDLVVHRWRTEDVYVMRGSSLGLNAPPDVTSRTYEITSDIVSAGDVDADGYDDFLVKEGTQVRLQFGSPAGLFTRSGPPIEQSSGWRWCSAGDVNGDGHADVLALYHPYEFSPSVEWQLYLGSSTGLQSPRRIWNLVLGCPDAMAAAGDLDGDGHDDVLFGVEGHWRGEVGRYRVAALRGGPNGLGSSPSWWRDLDGTATRFQPQSLTALGDVNGDGRADVLTVLQDPSNRSHLRAFHGVR
jgi:hypothetical protein